MTLFSTYIDDVADAGFLLMPLGIHGEDEDIDENAANSHLSVLDPHDGHLLPVYHHLAV